jgi:hypothetical protein
VKKIYYLPISLLGLAGILAFIHHSKNQCKFPVFDLNYKGKVVQACFQADSLTQHQHKNSIMLEIVSPSAKASGETIYFENDREMVLFACQILFHTQNKPLTRTDSTASNLLPGHLVIKAQDKVLSASDSPQSQIIEHLFCVANN